MNKTLKQPERLYNELKTELAICQIGGLFLALYQDEEVPELIMTKLEKDLPDYFQLPIQMTEKKVWFPIFFEHTFEQLGKQSNIYHALGIEALSEKTQEEFMQYLQYGRERFKALPYSIVFWVHPSFVKKLFHTAPDFHHWIFGTYDFTDITPVVINQHNKKILAFHQDAQAIFLKQIDHYLEKLIWQYEHWQEVKESSEEFLLEVMSRANLHNYYVKLYCTDKDGKVWLLDELLDTFLANDKQSFMTLLGDFGTGKSSFALHYFIIQAQHYLRDKSRRIPLFISLKDYQGKLNIESFITKEFNDKFKLSFSLAVFQTLALDGKFLFVFDGFDEMASKSDKQETMENFKELTKLSFENLQFMTQAKERNQPCKVFMTCRTHYFFTNAQEQDILKADKTVLYRNYATKSHYQVTRINLKEFSQAQIEEYVLKSVGDQETAKQFLNIIQETYNLEELSSRPLLLEMIVKTLPELKDKTQINAADLYKAYTDMWIERDDWRSQMTSQGKRKFMWELAVKMYQNGGDFSFHYSRLDKPNGAFLKQQVDNQDKDYYSYETTTCSFLNRDLSGNYKFIHKSFMEYFLAEYLFDCIRRQAPALLKNSQVNREVRFFLSNILSKMITHLDKQKLNRSDLSELVLCDIDLTGANLERANLESANLERANLENANLEKANLEGAMFIGANLEGANLENAHFVSKIIEDARFQEINIKRVKLGRINLEWANLEWVNLKGANLQEANLQGANLEKANLEKANLEKAKLEWAKLGGAKLEWAKLGGAKLEGANLVGADIRSANLDGANLKEANFVEANLVGAALRYANLGRANLRRANLGRANLGSANLENTNFEDANLKGAIFERAKNITLANFRNAKLGWKNRLVIWISKLFN